jgi:lysophospholipid acyltransferase
VELIGAYLIVLKVPRKFVGWTLSGYALAALIYSHIERMISDYGGWNLGINTAFMVQCTHLFSFAWDFADETIPEEKRSEDQKKYAIKGTPTVLEFMAAALNPFQSIAGPSGNFNDFHNYICLEKEFKQIPNTFLPCMKRFSAALFWVVGFFLLSKVNWMETIKSPAYNDLNVFVQLLYIGGAALLIRSRYYASWLTIESSLIASGQGYNGEDPKTKEPNFDRIFAIDVLGCEFGVFAVALAEVWNHGAHMWLKRYVYFRLSTVMNRTVALYVTYVVCAFWHGFYPMYFAGFLFYAITIETHKELYKLYCKYSWMRTFVFRFIF